MWKKLAGVLQFTTWNSEKIFSNEFELFFQKVNTKPKHQVHNIHPKIIACLSSSMNINKIVATVGNTCTVMSLPAS